MDSAADRAAIDSLIAGAWDALRADASAAPGVGEDLIAPLAALGAKGKRVRALALLASHRAEGNPHRDRARRVAAAIELFQVAALVHDDVLDDSDERRGLVSTHRALEAAHRERGWIGDAARFGASGAVLAGDLALMAVQRELGAALAGVDAAVAARTHDTFAAMASLCTAGQYADLAVAARPLRDTPALESDILAVMRSKTASYTAEGPLALGAALAGASPERIDGWRAVGVPLGIAFQIRDDVLGLVGAPDVTGKPIGDDLREGKRTVLLAHALRHADSRGRSLIEAAVGAADPQAITAGVDAIVRTGAVEAAQSLAADYAHEAGAALDALALADDADLRALIDATLARAA